MPKVMTVNDHKTGNTMRYTGNWYDAPDSLMPWLNEGGLAYSAEQIDDLWLRSSGRVIAPSPLISQYDVPADAVTSPRILQLTYYDPGSAAYRYHSAINASGVAVSAFGRFGDTNPHSSYRQWDGDKQLAILRSLMLTADYVMVHMDYKTLYNGMSELPPDSARIIRFYHGSVSPSEKRLFVENDVDQNHNAIQIGARLYHKRFSDRMHWLPIAMPVRDYECKAPSADGAIRISHSPTVRSNKGTEQLIAVVNELKNAGTPIELVLIEGMTHGEAIRLKQTCHITFDSFWLGIQGSGLEAAAMNQMVIAGDRAVRDEYIASEVGYCPYTYAEQIDDLRAIIMKAVDQPRWRKAQAKIAADYVRRYHSYEAVGKRFANILTIEAERGAPDIY